MFTNINEHITLLLSCGTLFSLDLIVTMEAKLKVSLLKEMVGFKAKGVIERRVVVELLQDKTIGMLRSGRKVRLHSGGVVAG